MTTPTKGSLLLELLENIANQGKELTRKLDEIIDAITVITPTPEELDAKFGLKKEDES